VSVASHHIPFDRLVDLAEGRLSPDEQARVRAHTSACSRCAPQLAWLERVIRLMRTSDYEDPPPGLADDIAREFDAYSATAPASLRERITAVLQFDSAQLPFAMGRRSGSSVERQLLFSAGRLDLEVRIRQADSQWEVSGQVLNVDVQGLVELRSPSGEVRAELNEMGEFLLTPVPAGRYSLVLRLAIEEIEIPDLTIGA